MRPDMAKVVTESPRRGHEWRNRKSRARVPVLPLNSEGSHENGKGSDGDFGPQRLKMTSYFRGDEGKDFSDKLGPLRRYLRKQVGRPWDAIYSDLRAHLDFRSVAGLHIWDHVKMEVQLHCVAYGKTIIVGGYEPSGLYVHPVTRLLCYVPETRHRYRKPVPDDVVELEQGLSLRRVNGIWYRARYGFKDVYHPPVRYGPGCGAATGRIIREGYFTSEPVLQEKKQLNRGELKAYGLKNGQAVPLPSKAAVAASRLWVNTNP